MWLIGRNLESVAAIEAGPRTSAHITAWTLAVAAQAGPHSHRLLSLHASHLIYSLPFHSGPLLSLQK